MNIKNSVTNIFANLKKNLFGGKSDVMDNVAFAAFKDCAIFADIPTKEIYKLFKVSQLLSLPEGDTLLEEGDTSETFYIVYEGVLNVVKEDNDHHRKHVLRKLHAGETIGEMALIDTAPRSASIYAATDAKVFVITFDKFNQVAKNNASFSNVYIKIAHAITQRLRQGNEVATTALGKQLEEYKMRAGLGHFMINTIVALCMFVFFLSWISTQQAGAVASTVITIPLTIVFVILFFAIMKSSELPLSTFGLTTRHWRKAVFESILFTIILCVIIQLAKWLLVHMTQTYMGHPVFEPYLTIHLAKSSHGYSQDTVWWMIFAGYWFVVSPLQELIARGGLQGPLEVFMTGRYAVLKAIIVSNLMFSTTHLFMGIDIALMAFFAGCYFGWLYSRHHTLIGVIIAHAMLGTWGTMVVGF